MSGADIFDDDFFNEENQGGKANCSREGGKTHRPGREERVSFTSLLTMLRTTKPKSKLGRNQLCNGNYNEGKRFQRILQDIRSRIGSLSNHEWSEAVTFRGGQLIGDLLCLLINDWNDQRLKISTRKRPRSSLKTRSGTTTRSALTLKVDAATLSMAIDIVDMLRRQDLFTRRFALSAPTILDELVCCLWKSLLIPFSQCGVADKDVEDDTVIDQALKLLTALVQFWESEQMTGTSFSKQITDDFFKPHLIKHLLQPVDGGCVLLQRVQHIAILIASSHVQMDNACLGALIDSLASFDWSLVPAKKSTSFHEWLLLVNACFRRISNSSRRQDAPTTARQVNPPNHEVLSKSLLLFPKQPVQQLDSMSVKRISVWLETLWMLLEQSTSPGITITESRPTQMYTHGIARELEDCINLSDLADAIDMLGQKVLEVRLGSKKLSKKSCDRLYNEAEGSSSGLLNLVKSWGSIIWEGLESEIESTLANLVDLRCKLQFFYQKSSSSQPRTDTQIINDYTSKVIEWMSLAGPMSTSSVFELFVLARQMEYLRNFNFNEGNLTKLLKAVENYKLEITDNFKVRSGCAMILCILKLLDWIGFTTHHYLIYHRFGAILCPLPLAESILTSRPTKFFKSLPPTVICRLQNILTTIHKLPASLKLNPEVTLLIGATSSQNCPAEWDVLAHSFAADRRNLTSLEPYLAFVSSEHESMKIQTSLSDPSSADVFVNPRTFILLPMYDKAKRHQVNKALTLLLLAGGESRQYSDFDRSNASCLDEVDLVTQLERMGSSQEEDEEPPGKRRGDWSKQTSVSQTSSAASYMSQGPLSRQCFHHNAHIDAGLHQAISICFLMSSMFTGMISTATLDTWKSVCDDTTVKKHVADVCSDPANLSVALSVLIEMKNMTESQAGIELFKAISSLQITSELPLMLLYWYCLRRGCNESQRAFRNVEAHSRGQRGWLISDIVACEIQSGLFTSESQGLSLEGNCSNNSNVELTKTKLLAQLTLWDEPFEVWLPYWSEELYTVWPEKAPNLMETLFIKDLKPPTSTSEASAFCIMYGTVTLIAKWVTSNSSQQSISTWIVAASALARQLKILHFFINVRQVKVAACLYRMFEVFGILWRQFIQKVTAESTYASWLQKMAFIGNLSHPSLPSHLGLRNWLRLFEAFRLLEGLAASLVDLTSGIYSPLLERNLTGTFEIDLIPFRVVDKLISVYTEVLDLAWNGESTLPCPMVTVLKKSKSLSKEESLTMIGWMLCTGSAATAPLTRDCSAFKTIVALELNAIWVSVVKDVLSKSTATNEDSITPVVVSAALSFISKDLASQNTQRAAKCFQELIKQVYDSIRSLASGSETLIDRRDWLEDFCQRQFQSNKCTSASNNPIPRCLIQARLWILNVWKLYQSCDDIRPFDHTYCPCEFRHDAISLWDGLASVKVYPAEESPVGQVLSILELAQDILIKGFGTLSIHEPVVREAVGILVGLQSVHSGCYSLLPLAREEAGWLKAIKETVGLAGFLEDSDIIYPDLTWAAVKSSLTNKAPTIVPSSLVELKIFREDPKGGSLLTEAPSLSGDLPLIRNIPLIEDNAVNSMLSIVASWKKNASTLNPDLALATLVDVRLIGRASRRNMKQGKLSLKLADLVADLFVLERKLSMVAGDLVSPLVLPPITDLDVCHASFCVAREYLVNGAYVEAEAHQYMRSLMSRGITPASAESQIEDLKDPLKLITLSALATRRSCNESLSNANMEMDFLKSKIDSLKLLSSIIEFAHEIADVRLAVKSRYPSINQSAAKEYECDDFSMCRADLDSRAEEIGLLQTQVNRKQQTLAFESAGRVRDFIGKKQLELDALDTLVKKQTDRLISVIKFSAHLAIEWVCQVSDLGSQYLSDNLKGMSVLHCSRFAGDLISYTTQSDEMATLLMNFWTSSKYLKAHKAHMARCLLVWNYKIISGLSSSKETPAILETVYWMSVCFPAYMILELFVFSQSIQGTQDKRGQVCSRIVERVSLVSPSHKQLISNLNILWLFYFTLANLPAKSGERMDLATSDNPLSEIYKEFKQIWGAVPLVSATAVGYQDHPRVFRPLPGNRPPSKAHMEDLLAQDVGMWILSCIEPVVEVSAAGKSCPKILTVCDQIGNTRRELLKANDDVRQDKIVQKAFSFVNEILRLTPSECPVATYGVIPLSSQSGVIEWIEGLQTIQDCLFHTVPNNPSKTFHQLCCPSSLSFIECQSKLQSARKNGTHIDVFCKTIVPQFHAGIGYWILSKFPFRHLYLQARNRYLLSTATNSFLGYVLGIGDRHLKNILISQISGTVVHIDFGYMFETGRNLRVPERVPFRFTPALRHVITSTTASRQRFMSHACSVAKILRQRAADITSVVAILADDLMATAAHRTQQSSGEGNRQNLVSVDPLRDANKNIKARRTILRVRHKLLGQDFSHLSLNYFALTPPSEVERSLMPSMPPAEGMNIENQFEILVRLASNDVLLADMFIGWSPWV